MTGSIYPDGRGRLIVAVDIGPPGGKRIRRTRSVRIADHASEAAAVKAAEAKLADLRAAYDTPTQVRTVGQALGLWLMAMQQRHQDGDMEHSTLDGYARQLRRQIMPHMGSRPLGGLTPADVIAWQRWLAAEGVSAATRARTLRTLKTALRWAVRMQLVAGSAAEPVDPPRHRADHGRAASAEDVRKLIHHPSPWRHLYAVLAGLGLRVGEGVGLAWDDVDLPGRMAVIGWQVQREDGQWVRKEPKDDEARGVPLPGFVVDALTAQRALQTALQVEVESMGATWRDEWGLVFTGRDGSPLHTTSVSRRLPKDCAAAGVARLTPHDLRRSCSSLLAAEGVTVAVRMAILGHSTSRLTEDVYTRAFDPDVRAAMDALDAAVRGVKP